MAEPGIRPMDYYEASRLRNRCDVYMDPRKSQCEVTHFYVDGFSGIRDWAKAALNVFNEKEQKNFHLEKVVKLNQVSIDAYLTFWARSAESDELRLFRAVVRPLGGYNVLLCEIKDGDEMMIPADHEEYCPRIPESEEDHSPYTRFDLISGSSDGLVDPNGGSAVGEGGVDLGSVRWDRNFYHSIEAYELSVLRHLCDTYMDPRQSKNNYGGGVTQFYADGFSVVRDWAKAALRVYNEKEQNNFYLEMVVKLNRFSESSYLTFWARSAESNERRLFRAAVNPRGRDKVLLCEIKDGDEMMVPAEHEECQPKSEEDYSPESPPHSPYTWFDLINGSPDGDGHGMV